MTEQQFMLRIFDLYGEASKLQQKIIFSINQNDYKKAGELCKEYAEIFVKCGEACIEMHSVRSLKEGAQA